MKMTPAFIDDRLIGLSLETKGALVDYFLGHSFYNSIL